MAQFSHRNQPGKQSRHPEPHPRRSQPDSGSWVDKYLGALGLLECAICGAPIHQGSCCASCWEGLPWLDGARCRQCQLPLAGGASVCADCLRETPPWQACQALLRYAAPVDQWLRRAKFHGDLIALQQLLELSSLLHPAGAELLLPMPMPARRLRERGLNPSRECARRIRGITLCDALSSVGDPPLQHRSQRSVRRRIRAAHFAVRAAAVRGRRVLLLDDVMTTGSTLRAASQALLRAGAAEVQVAVLFRTPRGGGDPQAARA